MQVFLNTFLWEPTTLTIHINSRKSWFYNLLKSIWKPLSNKHVDISQANIVPNVWQCYWISTAIFLLYNGRRHGRSPVFFELSSTSSQNKWSTPHLGARKKKHFLYFHKCVKKNLTTKDFSIAFTNLHININRKRRQEFLTNQGKELHWPNKEKLYNVKQHD